MSEADAQPIPPNFEANQAAEPISEHDQAMVDGDENAAIGGHEVMQVAADGESMEVTPPGTRASET
ncbi:hypothetical protein AAVH_33988, partial [Aphelenchoides avenae]